MGDATRFLLYQLNSSIFISFLEKLTGIPGIIPDPHFQGGGLHQIEREGFLKIHVDFNKHKEMKVDLARTRLRDDLDNCYPLDSIGQPDFDGFISLQILFPITG